MPKPVISKIASRAGRLAMVGLVSVAALSIAPVSGQAQVKGLTIRDDPVDSGIEPNPSAGAMYVSPDIWIRNQPDPNYDPRPFPATGVPAWVPEPHENPRYADPKASDPVYIYVRVTNNGTSRTTGNERLRVYWAKASTGLGWPNQWVDYFDTACGVSQLHGMEVTKERKDAQGPATTNAERDAYRAALQKIATDPALRLAGTSYWHMQQVVHSPTTGGPQHGVPAFLPWHREMVNRFEILMREADPTVTLLYWRVNQDPRVGVNLFSTGATGFMGAASGTVADPLTGLRPPTLSRNVAFTTRAPENDATVASRGAYDEFALLLESQRRNSSGVLEGGNHDIAHPYIGGASGQMRFPSVSAQDPAFFLLHTDIDRLWANWQRAPGQFTRLDTVSAYGTTASSPSIVGTMGPWDGVRGTAPWNTQPRAKVSRDASVVDPPIYDTAPLVVPALDPGQTVIIEVPWYPPNPANFACMVDPGHTCLLARIETTPGFPFGMVNFPEGMNVETNTRQNSKVAWKNVTVVPAAAMLRLSNGGIVRNFLDDPLVFRIRLTEVADDREVRLLGLARATLTVPREMAERWERTGRGGEGVLDVGADGEDVRISLAGERSFIDVELQPGDSFPVELGLDLDRGILADDKARLAPFQIDLEQMIPGAELFPETVVGGLRYSIDLSRLTMVTERSEWRQFANGNGQPPRDDWTAPEFDDVDWRAVTTPFATPGKEPTFFRRTFEVEDPGLLVAPRLRLTADDGAVVFLNGEEVARRNIADGPIDGNTRAEKSAGPLEGNTAWAIDVDPGRLRPGPNTIAVALFQAGDEEGAARFDLGFYANEADRALPPNVAIAAPAFGAQFLTTEPVPIDVQALDQDGALRSVQLFVDGERREQGDNAIRARLEGLSPGVHTISAEAIDDGGRATRAVARINVLDTILPAVEIVSPTDQMHVMDGQEIEIVANVLEARSAPIAKVELFVQKDGTFADGMSLAQDGRHKPIGEATEPPYRFSVPPLDPGMYMFQVGATDENGNVGVSSHLMVHAGG